MTDKTDKKIDLTTPPSQEEVSTWLDSLSENDRQQVRQQQLLNAAVNKKPDDIDWTRLSDGDFVKERMRRFGF
jgi:hypothetical protein